MRKLVIGVGAATAVAALGTIAAYAATATGSMNVTLTITKQCTVVSAQTLAFGSQGLLNANVDQTANITVLCTNGTTYDVGLDKGVNGASVTTRQMIGAGGTPDSVDYALYRDASRTQNFGETVGTDTAAGTGDGTKLVGDDVPLILQDRERNAVLLGVPGDLGSGVLGIGVDGEELDALVGVGGVQFGEARQISVVDRASRAEKHDHDGLLVLEFIQ